MHVIVFVRAESMSQLFDFSVTQTSRRARNYSVAWHWPTWWFTIRTNISEPRGFYSIRASCYYLTWNINWCNCLFVWTWIPIFTCTLQYLVLFWGIRLQTYFSYLATFSLSSENVLKLQKIHTFCKEIRVKELHGGVRILTESSYIAVSMHAQWKPS